MGVAERAPGLRAAPCRGAAVGLAALLALGCATASRPEGYDRAAHEARRNLRAPSNASYHRLLHREFAADFRRAVRNCRLEFIETRGATLLYRLGAEGEVLESMVYPESAFSKCVSETADRFALPPPPRADYWLGFFIDDCPLGGGGAQCAQLVP